MRVLVYTTLYPNAVDANLGVFIRNRLAHFTGQFGHTMQVVAPVPYFPDLPVFRRWHRFSRVPRVEEQNGVAVFHPRYLVTPKVGMSLYGLSMYLGTMRAVERLRRQFDFDVIDAHFLYPDAFAAILLGMALRKPVVVSARGSDVHQYSQLSTVRPLLRFVLKRASAIIAVSQSLKEQIAGLGLPESQVRVIGNGVDLLNFFPKDQLAARRRLNLPLNRIILLSVAQLTPVKGIHHLIEAMTHLKLQRPDLLLLIIGGATDAAYASRLQKQVVECGLSEMVRFVEAQAHHQLCDWYNACDLFCLGSLREGWPNVLLEAMACGKPVVATRVGGIPEVLCSPEHGILVDRVDGDGFAEAIRQAIGRDWAAGRIIGYARANSWEHASAKQQSLFQEVLAGQQRKAPTSPNRLPIQKTEGGDAN
jgi:glycosyltransferase involved in cell wall biosynthesis